MRGLKIENQHLRQVMRGIGWCQYQVCNIRMRSGVWELGASICGGRRGWFRYEENIMMRAECTGGMGTGLWGVSASMHHWITTRTISALFTHPAWHLSACVSAFAPSNYWILSSGRLRYAVYTNFAIVGLIFQQLKLTHQILTMFQPARQ